MVDADHVLFHDGTFVEIRRDEVAGRADELHAAAMGLMVRLGTGERREERVMDIDDLAGEVAAHRFVEHLHVAGEDDEVGLRVAEELLHLAEGRVFRLRRHGDMVEGDAVGLDDFAMVFVVGDHAGDDEREILGDLAGQEVVEAVFLLGAEQHDAARLVGVGDFPVHRELLGQRGEALGEFAGREVEGLGPDLDTHEEAGELVFRVLASFRDPALVAGDECGHLGHDAAGVGAGEAEGERTGHVARWKGRGERVKTRRRAVCRVACFTLKYAVRHPCLRD